MGCMEMLIKYGKEKRSYIIANLGGKSASPPFYFLLFTYSIFLLFQIIMPYFLINLFIFARFGNQDSPGCEG